SMWLFARRQLPSPALFPYTPLFRSGAGEGPFGGAGGFRVEDLGDLGDLFGGLFGRGRGRARTARGAGPQRGTDLETELYLSFEEDRKSTRLNSSHVKISYAVFCLKK